MESVVNIHEAKTHLSRLLVRVQAGEEITIAKAGKPIARLTAIHERPKQRVPGMDKGKVIIHPNFDDPIPEFDPDYMHPEDPMRGPASVRALLDAHAFIWWVLDMPKLSDPCRGILLDVDNEIVLSVASSYEIAYKAGQGRLTLPELPDAYIRDRLEANGFGSLPIHLSHAVRAAGLPRIHGDPFDRILVAQAQIEGMPILTADPAIARYDVETIW